jgi:hypothetical protein
MTDARASAIATVKPFDLKLKGNAQSFQTEIIRGRILEAAINNLRGMPGFNPAALSIVFGLKW